MQGASAAAVRTCGGACIRAVRDAEDAVVSSPPNVDTEARNPGKASEQEASGDQQPVAIHRSVDRWVRREDRDRHPSIRHREPNATRAR